MAANDLNVQAITRIPDSCDDLAVYQEDWVNSSIQHFQDFLWFESFR